MSRVLPVNMAPRAFSTVGLPASRRVELWETHNATALIGLDVQASEPLVATELNVRLPRVDLVRVDESAHAVQRTREVIDRSAAYAIAVYLTPRGMRDSSPLTDHTFSGMGIFCYRKRTVPSREGSGAALGSWSSRLTERPSQIGPAQMP
jgi:hypothetical protein